MPEVWGPEQVLTVANDQDEVIRGRPLSDDERLLIEWGRETQKATISTFQSALKEFMTLNATLLGGSVVFLSASVAPEWARFVAMLSFLVGLIAAVVGMVPFDSAVDLSDPTSIATHKTAALARKRFAFFVTGTAVVFGLVVAFLGVVARAGGWG